MGKTFPAVRFPPVWQASEGGLLMLGGQLTTEWLLTAYRQGIFPWPVYDGQTEILAWFSPDPQGDPGVGPVARLASAPAAVAERPVPSDLRRRLPQRDRRLCRGPQAGGRHLDHAALGRGLRRVAPLGRRATASRSGKRAGWPAACTAWHWAAFLPENPCFIETATPRKSPSYTWSAICNRGASSCLTSSRQVRTWSAWARRRCLAANSSRG